MHMYTFYIIYTYSMRDARHPTSPSADLATKMAAKMRPWRPRGRAQESNLDARRRPEGALRAACPCPVPLPKGVLAARGTPKRRSKRRTATRVKALNSRRLLLGGFAAKTGAKMEPVLIQNAIKIDVGKGFETGLVLEGFWMRFESVLGWLKVKKHALAAAGLVFLKEPLVAPSALPRRFQSET